MALQTVDIDVAGVKVSASNQFPVSLGPNTIESLTGAVTTIGNDHKYIHAGKGFDLFASSSGLAAGSSFYAGFLTPASSTAWIHWRSVQCSSSANVARVRVYEDAIFTAGNQYAPIEKLRSGSGASVQAWAGVTPPTIADGVLFATAAAGGNFANQPAGDGVTIVSDNAADVQTATIYGTVTGATTTVTTATVVLNGTTPVNSALTTFQNILGIELSAPATGTITLKETSGGATITTIAAAASSKGVVAATSTGARKGLPIRFASGASTAPVGVIGTGLDGSAQTSVAALDGTTRGSLGTLAYSTVTKLLIGAAASTVNVSVAAPYRVLSEFFVGSGSSTSRAGGAGGSLFDEDVLTPEKKYLIEVSNTGSVTASDVQVSAFWYEEA